MRAFLSRLSLAAASALLFLPFGASAQNAAAQQEIEAAMVWSVAVKHKGETANDNPTVNYNTYALGRDGYITLDLITQKNLVPKDKTAVLTLLDNLKYVEGKRYADFNSSTDKVAEYGLAALVAGVAAKKLGLFAVIAAFLAKFAKVGILAAAALGGGLWKRFRGKKAEQQQP